MIFYHVNSSITKSELLVDIGAVHGIRVHLLHFSCSGIDPEEKGKHRKNQDDNQ